MLLLVITFADHLNLCTPHGMTKQHTLTFGCSRGSQLSAAAAAAAAAF
jgi:hypothetical protein